MKQVSRYFAPTKEEVITRSQELKEGGWLVCPEFPLEKPEDITFITSMGIAVDLLYRIDQMDEALLIKLVEFYLHHPSLTVPVEPFHSILMAKMQRRPLLIWHLHSRFPGSFFQVEGNDQPVEDEELKRYFQELPAAFPNCMSCRHLNICFAWAKYGKDSCQKWKALLDVLQKNARELEKKTYSV